MKKFTNENIKKERKKMFRYIWIAIILLLAAMGCLYWGYQVVEKSNQNMKDLNSVILYDSSREDQKSYLNVKSIPYQFAVYDDTTDSYYIVSDGKYMYIVYMTVSDFDRLNHEDIYDNAIRVEGITRTTTKDVKQLAIDVYNDSLEEEEEKLSLADFENYFGSVYLDMTANDDSVASIPYLLFLLCLLFGAIFFVIGLWQVIQFSRNIKKMDDTQIYELDKEMNDEKAFYYNKAHLYLTEHYIINFGGSFRVIAYPDILWMYRFEQRTNGIKTSQSIKVFTNSGKTFTIATIDIITKQKREVFQEIWDTIASKNQNMLIGYTKENIKAMNTKAKEIKSKK